MNSFSYKIFFYQRLESLTDSQNLKFLQKFSNITCFILIKTFNYASNIIRLANLNAFGHYHKELILFFK